MLRLALCSLLVLASQACITRVEKAPTTPAPAPVAAKAAKAEPAKAAPTERNFVCERFEAEGHKPDECVSEQANADFHRARVKLNGGYASCSLPAGGLYVVCGPLFYTPEEKQADEKKPDAAKGKAPGAKK